MVGFHLARELEKSHEVKTAAHSSKKVDFNLDASDSKSLEKTIAKASPDAVINAVKFPLSVDEMELQKEAAYRLNTLLPENLARLQGKCSFKLVQVSTDGVYEGREGETYSEESPTYPKNYYCYTKALAEERIRVLSPDYLILRTEGVFGHDERGANFFLRLKKAAEEKREFWAADDQFSQPICGIEFARMARILIEKKASGAYNVTGADYLSRYQLAERICKSMGWGCKLVKTSIKQRGMPVQSSLKVDNSKVEKLAGKILSLNRQLEDLKGWEH